MARVDLKRGQGMETGSCAGEVRWFCRSYYKRRSSETLKQLCGSWPWSVLCSSRDPELAGHGAPLAAGSGALDRPGAPAEPVLAARDGDLGGVPGEGGPAQGGRRDRDACVYMYIYIYICIYVCIYVYIYTYDYI